MYALVSEERIIYVHEDYRVVEEERQSLISYGDYNDDEISIVEVEYYDEPYKIMDYTVDNIVEDIVGHFTENDIDLCEHVYNSITEEAISELTDTLDEVLNSWIKKHNLDKQIYTKKEYKENKPCKK